jgi:hypothetical protein
MICSLVVDKMQPRCGYLEGRKRTNSNVLITTWHASFPDFFISLRHYTVIGKQLVLSNGRNRVRGAVLGLSQDGARTNLFENFRKNSLKRDLSNVNTDNQPLFSLVDTFNTVMQETNTFIITKIRGSRRTYCTVGRQNKHCCVGCKRKPTVWKAKPTELWD